MLMTLTNYTDYGLRALMLLAIDPGRVQSTAALATRLNVSRHHLAKILMDLVAGGYLLSSRGPTGGVRLAKPPGQIRIGDVVRYLEREQAMVECFRADGGQCNLKPACRLRHMLNRAKDAFVEALNEKSLEEMSLVPTT